MAASSSISMVSALKENANENGGESTSNTSTSKHRKVKNRHNRSGKLLNTNVKGEKLNDSFGSKKNEIVNNGEASNSAKIAHEMGQANVKKCKGKAKVKAEKTSPLPSTVKMERLKPSGSSSSVKEMLSLPIAVRLNLMNEFTEVDTFIISMDSLLVEMMLHDYLSWILGGQSLVIIYMLESFLKSLKDKGGRFQLVWFDDVEICFRGNPTALLMREIVKKHFSSISLLKENIVSFLSPFCQRWANHVKKLSPSFLFCSNGTLDNNLFPGFKSSLFKECMTSLILYCFSFNLATVTFDGIQQNEATIFAYCWKPSPDDSADAASRKIWEKLQSLAVTEESSLESTTQSEPQITELHHFWSAVVENISQKNEGDTQQTEYEPQCSTFLKAVKYQQVVPLELRSHTLQNEKKLIKANNKFISRLCSIAADILHNLSDPISFPVFDLIDGRLFAYFLMNEKCVSDNPSQDPDNQVCLLDPHVDNSKSLYVIQQLNHPLFDNYATDIVKGLNSSILVTANQSPTDGSDQLLFLERLHWHSGKLITDDFTKNVKGEPIPQRIDKFRFKDRKQNWYNTYELSLEGSTQKVSFHPPKALKTKQEKVEVKVKFENGPVDNAVRNRFLMPNEKAVEKKKALDLFHQVVELRQLVLARGERNLDKRRDISVDLFLKLDELLHKELSGSKIVSFLSEKNQNAADRIWEGMFVVKKTNDDHHNGDLYLDMDIFEYRLAHVGESVVIQSNPRSDVRVKGFVPDKWQRDLLDAVDNNQSALIIAPTSAGKTFISYYCIEKVLQDTKDGLVVYICPTKALVNQVAATIGAKFKHHVQTLTMNQKLYGIFTRDIRKDIPSCRVLVTVPQCLEIFFLSPQKQPWRENLKYAIFDEVHCIGGGVGDILGSEVWEHIIQLAPCPFLALSATVGNVNVLHNWLTTHSENREVKLVHYMERHSELELYLFNIFDPKSKKQLIELNPLAVCSREVIRQFGVPTDQQMTAKQIYNLWKVMKNEIGRELKPKHFFAGKHFLSREDLRNYENALKQKFGVLTLASREEEQDSTDVSSVYYQLTKRSEAFDERKLAMNGIVDLVLCIQKRKMFPAICFSDDRLLCESFAKKVSEYFLSKENNCKNEKRERQNSHASQDDENDEWTSVVSQGRQRTSQFSLLKLEQNSDLYYQVVDQLKYKDSDKLSTPALLKCLERGIGYHHSGMTTTQKQSVEILFRAGCLSFIFATATLALGIHMPCKTVVIAVDSPYLAPLQYRQMIGRAGRRDFDKSGNVILYSVPTKKIVRLLTAPLPNLRANLPFTVSYILRLLALIAAVERNQTELASYLKKICSFLQQPFIVHTLSAQGEKLQKQLEYYFVFGCHFLNRTLLINTSLHPIGPAGIVTHLHYCEPGNFVFTYLLQQGVFHNLCKEFSGEKLNDMLVLVMSHLFTHTFVSNHNKNRKVKIVLDPLPKEIVSKLKKYNTEVCLFYRSFLKCVAENLFLADGPNNDNCSKLLPYSGMEIQTTTDTENFVDESILQKLKTSMLKTGKIGGPVFSITGTNDDQLDLMNLKLIYPLREGIYYDRGFVPTGLNLLKNHCGKPIVLNSFAYDFFKGKNICQIVKENGIMDGDAFHLLLDFSLVLKSVSVALMELGPQDDIVVQKFANLAIIYNEKFRKVQSSYL